MSDLMKWSCGELDFTNGPIVMGILNVTPDSFSDGGSFDEIETAVNHGLEMVRDGAGIIDVGPESSRPGSERVDPDEQILRAVPVIKRLASETQAQISIDTYDADVAKACLDAGATIINDITAGGDERIFDLAAQRDVPIVLMHMQGMPDSMQENPKYDDVVGEVVNYLLGRAGLAIEKGVRKENVILDPGIGFGKTLEHNLILMKNLSALVETGYRVLLGTSRKSFIGKITGKEVPAARLGGTIATTVVGVQAGVDIIRVHDVAENIDAVQMAVAMK